MRAKYSTRRRAICSRARTRQCSECAANAATKFLRVGYAPSLVAGIMPAALEKFQAATPGVRIELADLSSREMNELANAGRLDLLVTPEPSPSAVPGFQWIEFRRVSPVLVMPATHPLARWQKIAPARLRDLPLIGLARENFPDYVRYVRALLKPYGVAPRFIALENDGVSTLFAALEANHAAAILAEGIASIMRVRWSRGRFRPHFRR